MSDTFGLSLQVGDLHTVSAPAMRKTKSWPSSQPDLVGGSVSNKASKAWFHRGGHPHPPQYDNYHEAISDRSPDPITGFN